MADEAKWVTFDSDSDEALSLSDLPNPKEETATAGAGSGAGAGAASPAKDEQFEFRIVAGAGAGDHSSAELVTMCAAEDVFFHGQLLPLGSVSRSDSTASVSVDSSTSVSRSHSSNSCASSSDAPHSLSRIRSNTLYAYPSPKPRARPAGRNGGGRRSTGSAPPAGWGLLRLGVAMAPEMELSDIRVRLARGGSVKTVVEKRGNAVMRLLGGGLMGCKCSPEDAVSAKVLNAKKKGEGRRRVAGFMERRERMFEWLEELSLGKEPLMKFGL